MIGSSGTMRNVRENACQTHKRGAKQPGWRFSSERPSGGHQKEQCANINARKRLWNQGRATAQWGASSSLISGSGLVHYPLNDVPESVQAEDISCSTRVRVCLRTCVSGRRALRCVSGAVLCIRFWRGKKGSSIGTRPRRVDYVFGGVMMFFFCF